MFRFTQEPSSGSYNQCLAKITNLAQQCLSVQTLSLLWRQRSTSLRSEPYTNTHTRSEYAAITLTSVPTRTVEQDL